MRPHFQSPIFGFFGREYHEDILFFSLAHQQEPTYNKEENSTLYLFHHPRFFSLSKLFVFLKKSFQSVFFFFQTHEFVCREMRDVCRNSFNQVLPDKDSTAF